MHNAGACATDVAAYADDFTSCALHLCVNGFYMQLVTSCALSGMKRRCGSSDASEFFAALVSAARCVAAARYTQCVRFVLNAVFAAKAKLVLGWTMRHPNVLDYVPFLMTQVRTPQ